MATLAQELPGALPPEQSLASTAGNLATPATTPEQLDVSGFTNTAGSFRRGFRSGMNSIGATLNGIIGSTGEALGLTQFANDRFEDAKRFASFADSVDHETRDYGQVKDFTDLMDFVTGNAGKGVASSIPSIGLALGLRRPVLGVMGGAFPQEAGEQALNLREDPTVMATTTPGQRLGNAVAKGGINSVLEAVGGAEGQAARRLLQPSVKGIGKAVVKGTVGEGLTEGAQNIVGQKLHQELNPEKQLDVHDVINDTLAGAAGGGTMVGGAQAISTLPGAVADTVDTLRTKLRRPEKPLNPDGFPDDIANPKLTPDEVFDKLKEYDEKLGTAYAKVTDPDERMRVYQGLKAKYDESEIKPHIDKAIELGKTLFKGTKQFVDSKVKKSEMENLRKRLRDSSSDEESKSIMDEIRKAKLRKNGSPEDSLSDTATDDLWGQYQNSIKELRKAFNDVPAGDRNLGLHELSRKYPVIRALRDKRDTLEAAAEEQNRKLDDIDYHTKFSMMENRTQADDDIMDFVAERLPQDFRDGAGPEQIKALGDLVRKIVENPHDFAGTGIPHQLTKVFGPKFKEMTDYAIDRIHSNRDQKRAAEQALKIAFVKKGEEDDYRLNRTKQVFRQYLLDEHRVDKDKREMAINELAPRALDYLNKTGEDRKQLDAAFDKAFGKNKDKVLDELDKLRDEKPITSARAFEGGRANEMQDEQHDEIADESTTVASRLVDSPFADTRLDKVYTSKEAAEKGAEALRKEYGPKSVKFGVKTEGPLLGEEGYSGDKFVVHAEDADQEKLTPQEMRRVREPEKSGASGLSKGILIVRTDAHPTGVKLNLRRLTHLMMAREGQQTQEGGAKYVADMFSRGMSTLMTSIPGFRKFVASGKGEELQLDKKGNWTLPDDTPVATMRQADGSYKDYTYGDIKVYKMTRMELKGITSETIAFERDQINREYKALESRDKRRPLSGDDKDRLEQLSHIVASPEALQAEAVKQAVERSQDSAEALTYSEPHENTEEAGRIEGSMVEEERDRANAKLKYDREVAELRAKQIEIPKLKRDGLITGEEAHRIHWRIEYKIRDLAKDYEAKSQATGELRTDDKPGDRVLESDTNANTQGTVASVGRPTDEQKAKSGPVTTVVENKNRSNRPHETDTNVGYGGKKTAPSGASPEKTKTKFSLQENTGSIARLEEQLRAKYPGVTLHLDPYGKGEDTIYLAVLFLDKKDRGQGKGAAIMRDITSYADRTGKGIFLHAQPTRDSQQTLQELEQWYARFGLQAFPIKDRLRPDMTEMYRPPVTGEYDDEETGRHEQRGTQSDGGGSTQENPDAVSLDFTNRLSTQNIGKGSVDAETIKAVRDYIEKVLGPDAKVLFEKMAHAGEFAKLNDVETIKIAIDAIDPMSVGYHEALHAFFQRLMKADKKAAHTLLRAAGAAPVVARLRELLKGHPKALEQLNDPEERLAYMFQFSAKGEKGLLNIGPETKTWFDKVKQFFKTLSAIWSDEMGDALAIDRAGQILDAFHNGAFANRSTVAEVLHDKFPPDIREQTDRIFPALGRFMDKFIWTASGAVRDMNLAPLTDIVNKFHTDTAGGEAGFLQTRHTVFNRFMNQVNEIVGGMNNEDMRKLLIEMQSGERKSKNAQDLAKLMDEAHRYLDKSGVKRFKKDEDGKVIYNKTTKQPELEPIGYIENYFPRVPDSDYLRTEEGKKGFLELMKKYKIADPEGVYRSYSESIDEGNPREEDHVLGLAYYTPATNKRSLTNIPDAELAPYLSKDLVGTMSQYLSRAARRGEYTKRFGNSGEEIAKAVDKAKELGLSEPQEKTFDEVVRAMEGTLGANMSKELKALYGGLTTYQNIRLLPLAIFSSLVDPLGIVVRGGTLAEGAKAFWRGMTDLVKTNEDDAYELAKLIGSINTAHDAQVIGDMYSSQFMPTLQKRINDKFFRFIGMESFNKSMRIAASAAAENFIIKNQNNERYMTELGLTKDDISIVNDKLVLNDKVIKGLNLWVDQAILRPNAALRPVYMSDPNWILISHLKQYTYMFQKIIIARVNHELQHGNYTPAYALAGYVPMIIASDMMRAALTPGTGDDRDDWGMMDWFWRGLQRAGLFGPGQFAIDSANDFSYNKFGIESIAGPTVQQLLDFVRAGIQGQGLGNQLKKAIPGARLFQDKSGSPAAST